VRTQLNNQYKILDDRQQIKTAFERGETALRLKPGLARKKSITTVKIDDRLKCTIEEGDWKILSDLGENRGGGNEAPNPGTLIRGALGSCIAMGYRIWAAKMNVDIGKIAVNIEAEFDSRGEYGIDNISPGYSSINCNVELETEENFENVLKVLDTAEVNSSIHHLFKFGTRVARTINIKKTDEKEHERSISN
jgi:uncharacterized OsmC-like protein